MSDMQKLAATLVGGLVIAVLVLLGMRKQSARISPSPAPVMFAEPTGGFGFLLGQEIASVEPVIFTNCPPFGENTMVMVSADESNRVFSINGAKRIDGEGTAFVIAISQTLKTKYGLISVTHDDKRVTFIFGNSRRRIKLTEEGDSLDLTFYDQEMQAGFFNRNRMEKEQKAREAASKL